MGTCKDCEHWDRKEAIGPGGIRIHRDRLAPCLYEVSEIILPESHPQFLPFKKEALRWMTSYYGKSCPVFMKRSKHFKRRGKMKEKPQVGQKLYSLNVNNAARGIEKVLTPVIVVKVGKKYFDIIIEGCYKAIQYHIDTWREKTEYTPDSELYVTKKEWEDKKESKILFEKIRVYFDYRNQNKHLSLEQLIKIALVIDSAM